LKFFHSIQAKLIAIFVVIKVLPLILLALLAWAAAQRLGDTVSKQASALADQTITDIREVGAETTNDAIRALDDRARQAIERLTTDTARAVAAFLYDRDTDIRAATQLTPDATAYRAFLDVRTRRMIGHDPWRLKDDGSGWEPIVETKPLTWMAADPSRTLPDNNQAFNSRPPENEGNIEERPLFVEMSFVGLDGREKIKITNGDLTDPTLKDVSKRENTFVKAETYWPALKLLEPGEIYVSNVVGAYVGSRLIGPYTPERALKADIPYAPKASAYAGTENPVGRHFRAIVRWATPVVRDGNIIGYVTLALDHDHIRQFTDRIVPTDARYSSIDDAIKGNYAFMWDNRARAISHPRDYFIPGYDPETGDYVPPWLDADAHAAWKASGKSIEAFLADMPEFDHQSLKKKPAVAMIKDGTVGLDCRYLNFSPQCHGWVQLTENGGSGSFLIFFSGLWKLTTAAAIPYYTGQYGASRQGFGFVTIGANVDEFHSAATDSAARIGQMIDDKRDLFELQRKRIVNSIGENLTRTATELTVSTVLMVLVVIAVAIWIARFITRRITDINDGIERIRAGDLGYRLKVASNDEMGQLSGSLNRMADAVQESFARSEDARRRAEEANQLKSDFIASISHELRTPLNGILGFAEVLELELEDPATREYAATIGQSGRHLLAVVNDLLDLAKIESGKVELKAVEIPLRKFAQQCFDAHRAHAEGRGLGMDLTFEPGLPEHVVNDEQRVRQVLDNLLNNAIKFTREGSIGMTVSLADGHVCFAVKDSGCGIDSAHLDLIFEKFRQAGNFMTRDQGGSGLGLAIARELSHLLGGEIDVRSEVGQGSVFTFRIPLFLTTKSGSE
jgi:signal transduction histidine kinase